MNHPNLYDKYHAIDMPYIIYNDALGYAAMPHTPHMCGYFYRNTPHNRLQPPKQDLTKRK